MTCDLCQQGAAYYTPIATYTVSGLHVCEDCERLIHAHKAMPFSKAMDRVALAEAGYYINRKRARV